MYYIFLQINKVYISQLINQRTIRIEKGNVLIFGIRFAKWYKSTITVYKSFENLIFEGLCNVNKYLKKVNINFVKQWYSYQRPISNTL